MERGTSDTIVFRDTSHVDLSGVTDLNTKVESIERIELKGNSEIKFDAKDIFAMTDNINTILKIRGDSTSKVDIKGKWHEDPISKMLTLAQKAIQATIL